MILLILAVLWVAVLAPGFLRKRAERRSVDSIDSFHHQLHLLEQQTGPKIVDPAHRLESGATGTTGLPAISSMPGRPKLRLLGSTEQLDAGSHGELRGVEAPRARRRVDTYQRRQALKRRRDVVGGLVAAFVLSALLGLIPSFHLLWVVTFLSALAIGAYVALIVYARQLVAQRQAGPSVATRRPVPEARLLERVSPRGRQVGERAWSLDPSSGDAAAFGLYRSRQAVAAR